MIEYIFNNERRTLPFDGSEVELNALKETGYINEKASPWISVKHRYPEMNGTDVYAPTSDVVLVTNGREILLAFRQQSDEDEPPRWTDAGSEGWRLAGITHWMPLPRLPV